MEKPFKMKGSPMQRNFGIGGPIKKVLSQQEKIKRGIQTPGVKDKPQSSSKPKNKNSSGTLSYKEAYKKADKSKYKTYKEFKAAAESYNRKKYGTTEPTKQSKKLIGKYEGDTLTSPKVTKKTAKKELASRHQAKKDDAAKLKASAKRIDADVKSGKAKRIVSSVTGRKAVDYRKTEQKTKKRTKAGKLGVKIANIFRGKNKKVNPYRKPVKS
tara:strand:+ start:101 stop:739 length:639 start_codon:yes stop_codon:yes gene_type:complete